jgi:hypothetical protein
MSRARQQGFVRRPAPSRLSKRGGTKMPVMHVEDGRSRYQSRPPSTLGSMPSNTKQMDGTDLLSSVGIRLARHDAVDVHF